MSYFLFSMLKETTSKICGEKEVTYYDSDGKWLIQQDYKNGYLTVSYLKIWSIFESRYGLKYKKIKDFINTWFETNLGWRRLRFVRHC